MRLGVIVGVLIAALAASAPAGALLPEQVVRATPNAEQGPTAGRLSDGARVLAWTQWRGRTVDEGLDAFLKVGAAAPFRLNLNGYASADGVDVPWVAYTVLRERQTDIRLYNIDTGARSAPAGVNTRQWESTATLSGDWMLFERERVERHTVEEERVVLFNRVTLEERILDQVGLLDCCRVRPGQVAGDFVVWERCRNRCRVFRYRISTGETIRLKIPAAARRREQYAASVTPAGVVYAVRSGWWSGCGKRGLKLVRYFGAGDRATGTAIAARRHGTTVSRTFALARPAGGARVFLDREAGCQTWPSRVAPSDLVQVVDPG